MIPFWSQVETLGSTAVSRGKPLVRKLKKIERIHFENSENSRIAIIIRSAAAFSPTFSCYISSARASKELQNDAKVKSL